MINFGTLLEWLKSMNQNIKAMKKLIIIASLAIVCQLATVNTASAFIRGFGGFRPGIGVIIPHPVIPVPVPGYYGYGYGYPGYAYGYLHPYGGYVGRGYGYGVGPRGGYYRGGVAYGRRR